MRRPRTCSWKWAVRVMTVARLTWDPAAPGRVDTMVAVEAHRADQRVVERPTSGWEVRVWRPAYSLLAAAGGVVTRAGAMPAVTAVD